MSGPRLEIVAYVGAVIDGHAERVGATHALTDWHGARIGFARIKAAWKTPRSYVSSRMFSVVAVVDGHTYRGRTAGEGMSFRGKLSTRALLA